MPRIFLSHSSANEIEAVALKQWLADNGWDDVFLDVDPERGLVAGERWQEALRRAAGRCEAVVFVVSPAWAKSKWCLAEFLLAKSLHKLIFGVVLEDLPIGELPTEMTAEWQLCYLTGPGSTETIRFVHREKPTEIPFLADGLNRLKAGLQSAGLRASFFAWPPKGDDLRSPYRGLEPLDARDAAVFFGRDAEIQQGLDRLRGMRAAGDQELFVILGASGAGKSSFLRAGLLPRLARDDRHFFPLEALRPERSPLFGERGLAQVLSGANRHFRIEPANPGDVKAALKEGVERFAALLREIQSAACAHLVALPDGAPPPTLVLPVDQAEELFNADATAEARAFLSLIGTMLHGALTGNSSPQQTPLIVAFTIRSDRYEPLQTAAELAGLKTVVFDALRPMPPAQFKEVITGPASRATASGRRLEIEPALVQQLLADCAQGADTLPLLGLTLARLYRDYGGDGHLRRDHYDSMGGMTDVIRTEAESILATNPDTRKAQLESLHAAFIPWLATINPDNDQSMRRMARMADLPPASQPLIQALIEKRLLLSDARDGAQVVEVAHESLLRHWNMLADWLREERDDLKEADRLEQAAVAWNKRGQKADWLMEGERLAIAETLAAKSGYRERLNPTRPFLLASRQREEQRREDEENRRKAEIRSEAEKAAAEDKQHAAEKLAEAEARERTIAERSAACLRTRAWQLLGGVITVVILLVVAVLLYFKAQAAHREAHRLQLVAESLVIMSGMRPGGDERASLQLLAAQLLSARQPGSDNELDSALLIALVNKADLRKIWTVGEKISAVAFSPDGSRIVSGSEDGTLRLWNAQSGQPIGEPMKGHGNQVTSVAFSPPDGKLIVSGSHDGTLRLWNAQSGQPIGEPMKGHKEKVWKVWSVAFSPDGSRIVSGSEDKTLRLWDVQSRQPIREWPGHEAEVRSVAFNHDGTRIVSGCGGGSDKYADNTLRLWDVQTGERITELVGHQDQVLSVAFNRVGTRIVSGSSDNTLRLWNAQTGQLIHKLQGHKEKVRSVAFSPDGSRIVSTSEDKTLRLWNAESGQPIGEPMRGHENRVTNATFSPDGSRIVSGSEDTTLRLWNAESGQSIGKPMKGDKENVWKVRSVAFSPDGNRIVSGSEDGTLRLWNAQSGQPIPIDEMKGDKEMRSVAFSPDGSRIVSGSEDGTLRLWNAQSGQLIDQWKGHKAQVRSVAFSPDGNRIVSGGGDDMLCLWDVAIRQCIGKPLRGHVSAVTSVAFSPDGNRIVSGSWDRTLRLWDAQSGQPIGPPLRGHDAPVTSVAFTPDGTSIISGSEDGALRLWPAPKVWPDRLCAKLTRNMSRKEWREWVSPDIDYVRQCPDLPIPPDEPDKPDSGKPAEICPATKATR